MKILKGTIFLLGEYSGLYTNLKKGFERLGYKVCLISDGDGWKRIPGDINIKVNINGKSIISRILRRILIGIETKKVIENLEVNKTDIVLIINASFFPLGFSSSIISSLQRKCSNIFISAVGDDYEYLKYGRNYAYWPYMECEFRKSLRNSIFKKRDHTVLNNVLKIIPGAYEYAEAYRHSLFKNKLEKTIPMPVDVDTVEYRPNKVENRKIKIFHGLNREAFKGTAYITKALNKIEKIYGDYVEVIIDGNMPMEKYLRVLDEANVVIDQCKSYSYGMNALYCLAKGKIVLSGFENECKMELGMEDEDTIVVNITPNENQIYKAIERIIISYIENPNYIEVMGKKSRNFVEKHHDCTKVARKYLQVFDI